MSRIFRSCIFDRPVFSCLAFSVAPRTPSGRMPFLPPKQQRQSTEGTIIYIQHTALLLSGQSNWATATSPPRTQLGNCIHYLALIRISSHAHTVVWECCKDDKQSQWKMLKFDPQLPLNPLSDRHQIWHAWLRHGYLSPKSGLNTHVYYFFGIPIAYSRDACMDFNA